MNSLSPRDLRRYRYTLVLFYLMLLFAAASVVGFAFFRLPSSSFVQGVDSPLLPSGFLFLQQNKPRLGIGMMSLALVLDILAPLLGSFKH